ncbi:MAG: sigma-54 dependent transcriptional regulator [Desulfovibrio sp.]|jgi:two-component system NtrC family response regulator|nr:sigma-54 dependent transcriptional regulator [Desulfovibrio sp.]
MARILVVDDEAMVRTMLAEVAVGMGHEALTAATLDEGLRLAATGAPDVVYLDVLLPDGNGLAHVTTFGRLPCAPEIIVVTGFGDADGAETALRHGVWEYLQKPLRVQDITLSLSRVLAYRGGRVRRLGAAGTGNGGNGTVSGTAQTGQADTGSSSPAITAPSSAMPSAPLSREGIVGNSPALDAALELMAEAAASSVNVLVLGETGTGKELFARAVHRNSARAAGPFVTLDCASLTENLVESQLFGHVRGAFTGADRSRDGLLRLAHGGTLFLDEIGDLPLSIQGAFLRALELRRFRPVGASREVESDFRLVAATNKDLHEMVRLDMFRSDLLYRLRGLTITLPPLRERTEDLPELCAWAVDRFCQRHDLPPKFPAEDFLETVVSYPWPGNVRELVHAVERACAAARDETTLYARQLPTEIRVRVARDRMDGHAAGPAGSTVPAGSGGLVGSGGLAGTAAWQAEQGAATSVAGRPFDAVPAWPRHVNGAGAVPEWPGAPAPTLPKFHGLQDMAGAGNVPGAGNVHGQAAPAPQGFAPDAAPPTLRAHKADAERAYVARMLAHCRGDIREAARLADVSRGHFYELLKKHELGKTD